MHSVLRLIRASAAAVSAGALMIVLAGAPPAGAADVFRAGNIHLFHTPHWYEQHGVDTQNSTVDIPAPDAASSAFTPFVGFSSTSNMTYHGGSVMLTIAAYAIYWAPPPHTIPSDYETLIDRWFSDLGGSSLYNIVTQYYEGTPPTHVGNVATFGGSWVDTVNPYPHAGTGTDPLQDSDFQAEVERAIVANGWPKGGLNVAFFVFTPKGIESCADSVDCTIGTAYPVYCAYHSWFFSGASDVIIYANMPYAGTWASGYTYTCGNASPSPNNDPDADEEISLTSHEQFEAATDPLGDAWYEGNAEIGDKCGYRYGTVMSDGRNVTLNGNPYFVQQEWSNAAFNGTAYSGCVLAYPNVPAPTPTPTPTASPGSPTPTPTSTPAPTRTATAASTATASPTPTATNTPPSTTTGTSTSSPTQTPTNASTATGTPTLTSTPTPPSTSTSTPTSSPSRTATATSSATGSPTPTMTSVSTPTATNTKVNTTTATPTLTATATATGALALTGQVTYYANPSLAVNGAAVALQDMTTGATVAMKQTDATGQFTFSGINTGNWDVLPQKSGDLGGAIGVLDAVAVLQAVVGKITLVPEQQVGCDVSGDGTVSVVDAVYILQYVVGSIAQLPVAASCNSDWAFVPQPAPAANQQVIQPQLVSCQPGRIAYQPLVSSATGQNFAAVPFGDCNGSWQPSPTPAAAPLTGAVADRSGLHVARHPWHRGNRVQIPVTVDAAAGFRGVLAQLRYDPAQLVPVGIRPAGQALVQMNTGVLGSLRIALASSEPLSSGLAFVLEFETRRGRIGRAPVQVETAVIEP